MAVFFVSSDLPTMDINAMADDVIRSIPLMPELREKSGYVTGLTFWESPPDSMLHQTFVQQFNEPGDRFLERVRCYWDRGCAARIVRSLDLEPDDQRELIRACWLHLTRPSELPGWPTFDYGEPPAREPSGC